MFSRFDNRRFWAHLGLMGAVGLAVVAVSCGPYNPIEPEGPAYFDLSIPAYFPSQTSVPDNNLLSVQGVTLGRYLFYDGRVSGHSDPAAWRSCADCHLQAHAFEGGPDYAAPTPHAMLPLFNVAFNTEAYHWNGDTQSLEALVRAALTDPNEINGHPDSIVAKINAIDFYPDMFAAAFGRPSDGAPVVSIDRICKAIAQFVRTMVSADSKFDRYVRGETALTDEELKGYLLFTTEEGADCFHCHGGSGNMLFSTYGFANNGLDPDSLMTDPYDRFSVTGNAADRGRYRIPTLRNIEYTAPYMHDGRFSTLEEVIDQYSEGVHYAPNISPLMHHVSEGGVQLTEPEKQALKAFLLTLSDPNLLSNPSLGKPQDDRLP